MTTANRGNGGHSPSLATIRLLTINPNNNRGEEQYEAPIGAHVERPDRARAGAEVAQDAPSGFVDGPANRRAAGPASARLQLLNQQPARRRRTCHRPPDQMEDPSTPAGAAASPSSPNSYAPSPAWRSTVRGDNGVLNSAPALVSNRFVWQPADSGKEITGGWRHEQGSGRCAAKYLCRTKRELAPRIPGGEEVVDGATLIHAPRRGEP
jgi:hypothetical protein